MRIAVVLLVPYYAKAYSSDMVDLHYLTLLSLVWWFSAQSSYPWFLSFRSYDLLSVIQIMLVMGPSLYFYLRQYHLQPSSGSALLITTVVSAAILSILTPMYPESIYIDGAPSATNMGAALAACTVMSLAVLAVMPSMRNLAVHCVKSRVSNLHNRPRLEANPGIVLAMLGVFAPFAFYAFVNTYETDAFGVGIVSFAPAVTASGYITWSLELGGTHSDFWYLIGEGFSWPYLSVLFLLVVIWMVRSALAYAHSDQHKRSFKLSTIAILILYTVLLALWSLLLTSPFPLFAAIAILWTHEMRSMKVRRASMGVVVSGFHDAESMGPAIEEGYHSETKPVRVPAYYVIVSRIKRRKRLRK